MPSLSLGAVAGGYYVKPTTNWTVIPTTAGTGRYLNGQDTRVSIGRINYFDGKIFVVVSDQFAGANTFGIWHNTDPVNNPTGWTAFNPLGGTTAQNYSNISYNASQGRWYYAGPGFLVTSTTLGGTTSNTTPTTTYEGNFGSDFTPTGIAHNGSRTVVVYRGWAGTFSTSGAIFTTDNGLNYTQRVAFNSGRGFNDVCYSGSNTFIAVGRDHIVARSTDNGVNWNYTSLTNEGFGPHDIVKVASNGAGVIVARGIFALWTSTDNGVSWTKTYTDPVLTYTNYTQISPTNAQPVAYPASIEWNSQINGFVAMFGGVQVCSNSNGTTWTRNNFFPVTGLVINQAVYHPINDYWVAVHSKSNTDQYSPGVSKALAWTDNIRGI